MASNLLLLPIAFMIIAIIFSPIGLTVNRSCAVNPSQPNCLASANTITTNPACLSNAFNNPQCSQSVQFLGNASIAFTPTGYSFVAASYKQQCENVQIGGVTVSQAPVLGTLSSLPFVGNFLDFMVGLGQYVQQSVLNNLLGNNGNPFFPFNTNATTSAISPNANTINACFKAASSVILVFNFTPQDILTLFVGAILTAAGIAVLTSIVLNAGGTLIIFQVSSMGLIYIVLTALGYATWATIPAPFGAFLYLLNSLSFALGIADQVSSLAT